jgi:dTDP-4-dehydrorhamnose reductase
MGLPLVVVEDQIGSPTPTTLVAQAVCELLGQRAQGTFPLASAGYVSRFGMTQFVFERLGLDVDLRPCCSREYPAPADRPLNSRFDCSKIQTLLKAPLEPWQQGLERFLRQYEKTPGHRRSRVHRQQLRSQVLSEHPDCLVVNLDKLTYAGNLE